MKRALALIEQQKAQRAEFKNQEQTEPNMLLKRKSSASRAQTEKLNLKSDSGMSSRKSTAVSSTSRIGSSGTGSMKPGRVELLSAVESKPPYELSLQNKPKKPPHKLKPLSSALANAKLQDLATEFDTFAQKQILREMDQELTDYLDCNQIMNQMESAFSGKPSQPARTVTLGSKHSLDPILEEDLNSLQLVTYLPSTTLAEQRAKKNELLKKRVKKVTQGSSVSAEDTKTFLTSCATKDNEAAQEVAIAEITDDDKWRSKKYYKYPEDELLDEMDQHEKDMNDMLKYLTEVEDLIKGQDLKQIQSMMDVTKEGMNQHFEAYDKIKEQIKYLDSQADEAIKSLNFYGDDKALASKYQAKSHALAMIEEEDKEAQQVSQEHSKKNIVDKLLNMNQSMRDFSIDLESKLDQAYKSGAGKKYGYDSIANLAHVNASEGDDKKSKKEDRVLNKIASQAQTYLDSNAIPSFSKQGQKLASNKAIKALPPSQAKVKSLKKGNNNDLNNI